MSESPRRVEVEEEEVLGKGGCCFPCCSWLLVLQFEEEVGDILMTMIGLAPGNTMSLISRESFKEVYAPSPSNLLPFLSGVGGLEEIGAE